MAHLRLRTAFCPNTWLSHRSQRYGVASLLVPVSEQNSAPNPKMAITRQAPRRQCEARVSSHCAERSSAGDGGARSRARRLRSRSRDAAGLACGPNRRNRSISAGRPGGASFSRPDATKRVAVPPGSPRIRLSHLRSFVLLQSLRRARRCRRRRARASARADRRRRDHAGKSRLRERARSLPRTGQALPRDEHRSPLRRCLAPGGRAVVAGAGLRRTARDRHVEKNRHIARSLATVAVLRARKFLCERTSLALAGLNRRLESQPVPWYDGAVPSRPRPCSIHFLMRCVDVQTCPF